MPCQQYADKNTLFFAETITTAALMDFFPISQLGPIIYRRKSQILHRPTNQSVNQLAI